MQELSGCLLSHFYAITERILIIIVIAVGIIKLSNQFNFIALVGLGVKNLNYKQRI
jgi:hypothetical protein